MVSRPFTKSHTNQLKYYTKTRTNLLINLALRYSATGEPMKRKDKKNGKRKLAGMIIGYSLT